MVVLLDFANFSAFLRTASVRRTVKGFFTSFLGNRLVFAIALFIILFVLRVKDKINTARRMRGGIQRTAQLFYHNANRPRKRTVTVSLLLGFDSILSARTFYHRANCSRQACAARASGRRAFIARSRAGPDRRERMLIHGAIRTAPARDNPKH